MSRRDPHDSSTRMGQGMIAIGFVIGIALLTFVFDDLQQDRIRPNENPDSRVNAQGIVEVELERNHQGHYIVPGEVNGVPADFLLDTGATDVVIPESLARRAGLEYGLRSQAMTANGVVAIYNTVIDELRLAEITLREVPASINPAMDDRMVLLGMSALRQVEFNQRGGRLNLRHAPSN